ncbi:hypothetical protein E2C01_031485 [Portunus trituberculatus]|uniref:Uncharacterized protein n=1 Tax=Portunus trituberculatus TaxID=210409 RepID=A0A5B7ESX4_PORTR|nr:hypothetical protein [Portunus trituberculatus]
MAPKRLISDENKEFSERVQVLVSHSPPLVGSQEPHQEKSYNDVFMDGDSSSSYLPPSPHPSHPLLLSYPSPAFTYMPRSRGYPHGMSVYQY